MKGHRESAVERKREQGKDHPRRGARRNRGRRAQFSRPPSPAAGPSQIPRAKSVTSDRYGAIVAHDVIMPQAAAAAAASPAAEWTTKDFPREPMTAIDPKDENTPDDWVPRHPDLIRLTGRHPLNCEAPLTQNYEHGFITPSSLHFVRNHGAVPRGLKWEDHKIRIHGAVSRPCELSMDDLTTKFPVVRVPVTLVCAGNRRREENMVKKTIGFSWGACAVSTNVWTGVRLCDILKYVGVKTPEEGANHVCFVGTEDLPKAKYGTSMKMAKAMDPSNDVLIAWEANGERLLPDHGFPVRLIIPGWIGGRMVKWLQDIEVTPVESNNYYHYFDNRVLPSHVDAEMATAEGWWYKPEYIITELNINSAIVVSTSIDRPTDRVTERARRQSTRACATPRKRKEA